MLTVASDAHRAHAPFGLIIDGGTPIPAPEVPERAERIRAEIAARGLGPVREPKPHVLDPVLRVHTTDYVEFLSTLYDDWLAATDAEPGSEATAYARPIRGEHFTPDHLVHPIAKLGWY